MPAYEDTPAGELRRAVAAGALPITGDPTKMVRAMLDSVEQSPAPRPLVLGSGSYLRIRAALMARIQELDGQREVAESTELDA